VNKLVFFGYPFNAEEFDLATINGIYSIGKGSRPTEVGFRL